MLSNINSTSFGGFKQGEIAALCAVSNRCKSLLSIGTTNFIISPKECAKELTWYEAMQYCESLTIDGKNDWRLPNKDELNQIYDSENDFVNSYHWASTENDSGNYAWSHLCRTGNQNDLGKDNIYCVRAVRTI